MIYSKTLTSKINGVAGNPSRADLPVTNGLIYQVQIYLPPGSSGLLYVWICDGAYQAWPSEPGERFFGDNVVISFPDMYWIKAPDHKLKIWHYNLDDTYTHKFTVRIGQVSAEAFIQSFMPSFGQKPIEEVLKELAAQQETEKEARIKSIEDYFALEEEATIEEESD